MRLARGWRARRYGGFTERFDTVDRQEATAPLEELSACS